MDYNKVTLYLFFFIQTLIPFSGVFSQPMQSNENWEETKPRLIEKAQKFLGISDRDAKSTLGVVKICQREMNYAFQSLAEGAVQYSPEYAESLKSRYQMNAETVVQVRPNRDSPEIETVEFGRYLKRLSHYMDGCRKVIFQMHMCSIIDVSPSTNNPNKIVVLVQCDQYVFRDFIRLEPYSDVTEKFFVWEIKAEPDLDFEEGDVKLLKVSAGQVFSLHQFNQDTTHIKIENPGPGSSPEVDKPGKSKSGNKEISKRSR